MPSARDRLLLSLMATASGKTGAAKEKLTAGRQSSKTLNHADCQRRAATSFLVLACREGMNHRVSVVVRRTTTRECSVVVRRNSRVFCLFNNYTHACCVGQQLHSRMLFVRHEVASRRSAGGVSTLVSVLSRWRRRWVLSAMTNRCLRPTAMLPVSPLSTRRTAWSLARSLPDEHGEIESGRDTGELFSSKGAAPSSSSICAVLRRNSASRLAFCDRRTMISF